MSKEKNQDCTFHIGPPLTRLDWLAGLAMHGMLSNPNIVSRYPYPAELYKLSYKHADAMIKEGKRNENED